MTRIDYSLDNIEKIKYSKEYKRGKDRNNFLLYLGRALTVFIYLVILGCVGGVVGYVGALIKQVPSMDEIEILPEKYTSIIYSNDGKEIKRLYENENREYVYYDDISDYLRKAVVSIEDERFFEHTGIDIKGIGRAVVENFKSKSFSQGASTITQQVIKNNVLEDNSKNIDRKIKEQYTALMYERYLSSSEKLGSKEKAKEYILEVYMNTILLSNGFNGVQTASRNYFGKSVKDLNLAESSILAGITQNPYSYDPVKFPEKNKKRAKMVLDRMLANEYIDKNEHDKALIDIDSIYPLIKDNIKKGYKKVNTYYEDYIIESVIDDLISNYKLSRYEANEMLYNGGLRIVTTIDSKVQNIVDEKINEANNFPKEIQYYEVSIDIKQGKDKSVEETIQVKNKDEIESKVKEIVSKYENVSSFTYDSVVEPQVATIIVDNNNGYIRAIGGGRGEKTADRAFNRATQAKRQVGSVFKIISAYAPALDTGVLNINSYLDDSGPYKSGGKTINNYDFKYRGRVSLRDAIRMSYNVVAVKTLLSIGYKTSEDYLHNMGVTSIDEKDLNPSMALGGLHNGVTQLELAGAFATIANNGNYNKPVIYSVVTNYKDEIILSNLDREEKKVFREETCVEIIDLMRDVITNGTGKNAELNESVLPVVGKTGTTNDTKDLTFVGITPNYTCSIWMGNDNGSVMDGLKNQQYHINLWRIIMDEVELNGYEKPFNSNGYENTRSLRNKEIFDLDE